MPLSKEADKQRKRKQRFLRGDRPALFRQSYPHWEDVKHLLSPKERTIIEGYYLQCLTDKAIALQLGLTPNRQNVAKQRLAALEKIKSLK